MICKSCKGDAMSPVNIEMTVYQCIKCGHKQHADLDIEVGDVLYEVDPRSPFYAGKGRIRTAYGVTEVAENGKAKK